MFVYELNPNRARIQDAIDRAECVHSKKVLGHWLLE